MLEARFFHEQLITLCIGVSLLIKMAAVIHSNFLLKFISVVHYEISHILIAYVLIRYISFNCKWFSMQLFTSINYIQCLCFALCRIMFVIGQLFCVMHCAGIFYTTAIIGPAIGYIAGGKLLEIYCDVGSVNLNESVKQFLLSILLMVSSLLLFNQQDHCHLCYSLSS